MVRLAFEEYYYGCHVQIRLEQGKPRGEKTAQENIAIGQVKDDVSLKQDMGQIHEDLEDQKTLGRGSGEGER